MPTCQYCGADLTNTGRKLLCAGPETCTIYRTTPTPVIDDPRDTNLASDCAPTFIVEYGWKGQRETYKVQSIQHGKKFISEAKEMEHPDSYSGPYYIHESRIRHEE